MYSLPPTSRQAPQEQRQSQQQNNGSQGLPLIKTPTKVISHSDSCSQKHSLKLRLTSRVWSVLGFCGTEIGRDIGKQCGIFFFSAWPCLHSLFRSHRYARPCFHTAYSTLFLLLSYRLAFWEKYQCVLVNIESECFIYATLLLFTEEDMVCYIFLSLSLSLHLLADSSRDTRLGQAPGTKESGPG